MQHALYCLIGVIVFCPRIQAAENPCVRLEVNSQAILLLSPLSDGIPTAGKRVKVTPSEYAGREVFHTVYLPETWKKGGQRLPIIFEYWVA